MSMRAFALALGVVTAILVAGAPGPAAAAGPGSAGSGSSAVADRAFAEVAGCVSGADTLLASIVVDESASLRSTDPRAMRVSAITTAVDALQELRSSTSGRLDVQVSMSTFARGYDNLVGWGKLNAQQADRLRTTAARVLPQRDSGNATDYRKALQGAQGQLDDRASQVGSDSVCKVMLWFTDGALDVDAATDVAAQQLCRPRGIADAVRRDQISVITLALITPGSSVTPAQRDQLRAVAEGTGNSVTCGTTPIPSDASSGVYLSANDPEALRRMFAGATAFISGATGGPSVTCPGPGCAGGRFSFVAEPGVGGFRVVADVGSNGRAPVLVGPGGTRMVLPTVGSRSAAVPGGTVDAFGRDGLVTATMSAAAMPSTPSRWTLDLGRTGGAVDLYWYWGAGMHVNAPKLVAGSTSHIRGALTGTDGQPLDPAAYRSLDVVTKVGGRAVSAKVAADGSFVSDVNLPARSGHSEEVVNVVARARTRGSGLVLGPLSFTDAVPVTLPPAFPQLSPKRFELRDLEGV